MTDPLSLPGLRVFFKNGNLDFPDRLAIARQFKPSRRENLEVSGFTDDPMGEVTRGALPRPFVHKYPDRILILTTNQCAVLCRFCTRKRITYKDEFHDSGQYNEAAKYIEENPEIKEIIFSGGDPFMLSNDKISQMTRVLLQNANLKKVRFHSRMITMAPSRFNGELLDILKNIQKLNKTLRIVLHVNHAAEISPHAQDVICKLREQGIELLSQTVLLRRINDSARTMSRLLRKLVQLGIQPYYLHQLDRVSGSAHFEVDIKKGLNIMNDLRDELPACCLPLYVSDGPKGKREVSIRGI